VHNDDDKLLQRAREDSSRVLEDLVIGGALWEIEQLCSDEKLETFWASEALEVAEAKTANSNGNMKPMTAQMLLDGTVMITTDHDAELMLE